MLTPILSILRAAHCRSTHHYFAIDAIPLVQTAAGERLARQLVAHHVRYLRGAKDPDERFRDFQNHIVHVEGGYWGGAPRVAHKWYDRLQQELERGDYAEAAYAAGVLSHYFTDPIQPLHTGQTDREAIIHRPLEWSICQSYQSIYDQWSSDQFRVVFQLADGPGWLGEAILHSARYAHRYYDLLVNSYRLEAGIANPRDGLTREATVALAELFGLAITGWARVIERAAADVEARMSTAIQSTTLIPSMALATITVPHRLWLRRLESKEERTALEELLSEYQQTGKLRKCLPCEVDIKQRVAKVRDDEMKREMELASRSKPVVVTTVEKFTAATSTTNVAVASLRHPLETNPSTIPFTRRDSAEGMGVPRGILAEKTTTNVTSEQVTPEPIIFPITQSQEPATNTQHGAAIEHRPTRLRLADTLVEAPSIGPKTAARFARIDVLTVEDLLAQSAEDMAVRLNTRWITSEVIRQWQDQARLMCQLGETHARDIQLLVGAGFNTPQAILAKAPDVLLKQLTRYSMTSAGVRYRRGAEPPTLVDVGRYIQKASEFVSGHEKRAA